MSGDRVPRETMEKRKYQVVQQPNLHGKTVRLSWAVLDHVKALANFGESYDAVIRRLLKIKDPEEK